MLNPEYQNPNKGLWPDADEKISRTQAASLQITRGLVGVPIIDEANKLYRKLNTDTLTGVRNRAYFESFKENEFDPETSHNRIGLILLDLNGLKKINDTYGHDVGDQAIKNIIDYLKSKFKKNIDDICRIGGDEFAIICRNKKDDQNFESNLNYKMQNLIAQKPKNSDVKTEIDFAYGVAVYQKDDKNLDNTKKRADLIMYRNKQVMKR